MIPPRNTHELARETHPLLAGFMSVRVIVMGFPGEFMGLLMAFMRFLLNEDLSSGFVEQRFRFRHSPPLSLDSRWKGEFDLIIEFTGFLCFSCEMVESVEISETVEQVEVYEVSEADKGLQLIDTITDKALSWVGPESRGITSVFGTTRRDAYMVVEYRGDQEGFR